MLKNLVEIQNELKAPKSNFNSFGKYRYRSAEDILTAVKPLLRKYGCQLTITDDVIAVADRVYIKATVTITDADGNVETVSALAREDEVKKGMDGSQITGTASSYARKYALNGLFLIDDTKDADTDEYHDQTHRTTAKPPREDGTGKTISKEEQEKLIRACAEAGPNMTLDNALAACKKTNVADISKGQYQLLMQRLGATA